MYNFYLHMFNFPDMYVLFFILVRVMVRLIPPEKPPQSCYRPLASQYHHYNSNLVIWSGGLA